MVEELLNEKYMNGLVLTFALLCIPASLILAWLL